MVSSSITPIFFLLLPANLAPHSLPSRDRNMVRVAKEMDWDAESCTNKKMALAVLMLSFARTWDSF